MKTKKQIKGRIATIEKSNKKWVGHIKAAILQRDSKLADFYITLLKTNHTKIDELNWTLGILKKTRA